MTHLKRSVFLGSVAGVLLLASPLSGQLPPGTVSGVVLRSDGEPAEGAWVRRRTSECVVKTGADGTFLLDGLTDGSPVTISAWYPGHKLGWVTVVPPAQAPWIALRLWDQRDNKDYAWITSFADPANPAGCGHCHSPGTEEWSRTAHAGSAVNPRFLSMYNGTRADRNQAAAPGQQQDFPGTAGACANCHAPGAAASAPFTTGMNTVAGVNREGIFCDFCHKVGAVYLDPATGLPYHNAPGVQSMRLFRPHGDDQIFFGPLDDVESRASRLPVESKSEFCAPCHQFSFWGTPIYESFREWRESPYRDQGIECQTCHMPAGTSPTFVLPAKGGLERDPKRLASHLDLGVKDPDFMRATIEMKLEAASQAGRIEVAVSLTNRLGGHHVPTDYPGRNMILVVSAVDRDGKPLAQLEGETVLAWGDDLAGRPGKGFAKILKDLASGEEPVVNYWKPVTIASDNRIPALATDRSRFAFAPSPAGGPVTVSARLVFRRLFRALALRKGWDANDIPMTEGQVMVE